MLLIFLIITLTFSDKLPGATFCNLGFDFRNGTTKLTMLDAAKGLPFFEFHNEKGKTFHLPKPHQSYEWEVPDEVYVRSNAKTVLNSVLGMSDSFSYVQTTTLKGYSVSGGFNKNDFGVQASYKHELGDTYSLMKTTNDDFLFSNALYLLYYVSPTSFLWLDYDFNFQYFVDGMPTHTPKTSFEKKVVRELIKNYGSHFSNDVIMGGKYHFDSHVKKSFVNESGAKWVTEQFQLDFYYKTWDLTLGGGIYNNKSEIKVDTKFTKAAKQNMYFEGGDTLLQSNATLGEWRESILDDQTITNATLSPIWELFDDDKKAAVVKSCVQKYVKTGYLPTMEGRRGNHHHHHHHHKRPEENLGFDTIQSGFDRVTYKTKSKIFRKRKSIKMTKTETEGEIKCYAYDSLLQYRQGFSNRRLYDTKDGFVVGSRKFYHFAKRHYGSNKHLIKCYKERSEYVLNREGEKEFKNRFLRAVDRLPQSYDYQSYRSFVFEYGTNYVSEVVMGGDAELTLYYPGSKYSEDKALNEAAKYFRKKLFNDNDNSYLDISFFEDSEVKMNSELWSDFVKGVDEFPIPLRHKLLPISDLIVDSHKSANINRAISSYEKEHFSHMSVATDRLKN